MARDGILFEGIPNQEMLVIGDIDLVDIEQERARGTVLPLRDSQRSREVAESLEVIPLRRSRD